MNIGTANVSNPNGTWLKKDMSSDMHGAPLAFITSSGLWGESRFISPLINDYIADIRRIIDAKISTCLLQVCVFNVLYVLLHLGFPSI